MSVIAWDGRILAADRQMTDGRAKKEGQKLYRYDNYLLAFTGSISAGLAMVDWYHNREHNPSYWPRIQEDPDYWCTLVVVTLRRVFFYEKAPFAIPVLEKQMAWGSGGDFALGAMAAGATALQAIEIACRFDKECGMGLDFFPRPEYGE